MEHKKPYLKHCQHCIEEIVKVCSRGRNCVSKSVKRKKHFSSFTCTLILGNFLRKYLTTFFRFYFRRKFPLRNLTRFSMHLHIPLRFFVQRCKQLDRFSLTFFWSFLFYLFRITLILVRHNKNNNCKRYITDIKKSTA